MRGWMPNAHESGRAIRNWQVAVLLLAFTRCVHENAKAMHRVLCCSTYGHSRFRACFKHTMRDTLLNFLILQILSDLLNIDFVHYYFLMICWIIPMYLHYERIYHRFCNVIMILVNKFSVFGKSYK